MSKIEKESWDEFSEEVKDIDEIEEFSEPEEKETPFGEEKAKKSGKKEKKGLSEIVSFLLYVGIAMAVTFLIIHFVGQRTVVSGPSMEYTLMNGDNIILDKISYQFGEPERFDVIVFPVDQEDKHYIKRVVGLPGETVQIVNGFIYITDKDGKFRQLEESYGKEIMIDTDGSYLTTAPYTLGEDEYYVLGDNRNNSIDSRKIGAISRDIIIGKAWIRIYPFNAIGKIN